MKQALVRRTAFAFSCPTRNLKAQAGICSGNKYDESKSSHPVVGVSWYDAVTYCKWVGGRLPTEAEWEKAASWDAETQTKFVYPWGNTDPKPALLNYNREVGDTTPVENYPDGVSPYDLFNMAGNVWEWTSSPYQPYPYNKIDGREDIESFDQRVFRGGTWDLTYYEVRSAHRNMNYPADTGSNLGFRCARSPEEQ